MIAPNSVGNILPALKQMRFKFLKRSRLRMFFGKAGGAPRINPPTRTIQVRLGRKSDEENDGEAS